MPKINRFWSQVSTGLTLVACLVVAFGVDAQESQWLTVAAFVISPNQQLVKCTPEDGPPDGMVVVRIPKRVSE